VSWRQIFRTPVPEEVDEEFAFHVEMRVREYLAEGRTLEEAREAAVERFGDLEEVKAICRRLATERERRRTMTTWWKDFAQDVRFGLRQFRSSPVLAVAAVGTLALGIGANTAVFSAVNGVLLTPLPFEEPDRLVEVRTRYLPPSGFDIPRFPISVPELLDLREASTSFEALGLYTTGTRTLTRTEGEPARVPTVFLDRAVLEALGVEPAIGRWFTEEEDRPGVSIGLIGHDLWVSAFGADPSVVGREITLDDRAFTVTGVMPEDFALPSPAYQIFENIGVDPANPGNRAGHGSVGLGRLADGVTMERLRAEAEAIHAGWAEQYPHNVAHFPIFERLPDNLVGADVRRSLLVLLGAVGIVLLIATVNVANLLLARGERRQVEVAVRTSLGADRGRIVRQLLTESLTLAVAGGALGLLLGHVGLQALLRVDPGALPRVRHIGLDGTVLLFTAGVTLVTTLLFGLLPALRAGRNPGGELTGGDRATSPAHRGRFRRVLVTAEVALSLVVVLGAGLIGRSFQRLTAVDPGVEIDDRLVFQIQPAGAAWQEEGALPDFYRQLRTRLAAIPGVTSVAGVSHLPLTGSQSRNDFLVEGRPRPAEGEPTWSAQWTAVLPGYFETMGIEPLRGRLPTEADRAGAEPVVVVGRGAVERYFPGEDPLGARVALARDSVVWGRVVGVVPDTRTTGLDTEVIPQIYYPYAQGAALAWQPGALYVTIRTAVPPREVVAATRAAVRELAPDVPLTGLGSMQSVFDRSVARSRFVVSLLGAFALIALTLAAVGIYGVVAYSVSRRTREIGIRMALGAGRAQVTRRVVAEGAWPAAVGVAIGLPLAWLATGVLSGMLYEVSPRDPVVFAALSLGLLALAVASSWLPARRATRMAPTDALQGE